MTGYQIELVGHLDYSWGDWLGSAALTHLPNGRTRLDVELLDQSALLGLLLRLHSLGLQVLSLNRTPVRFSSPSQSKGD